MATLQFWYEFASTYSYPAAMRIDAVAERYKLDVSWQPFLLGPIFKTHGWDTSPFNLHPEKGRYMWRDLARICAKLDLPPITRPNPFPQNGLKAARIALALTDNASRKDFSRAVFQAEFADGLAIDDDKVLNRILEELNLPVRETIALSRSAETKDRLKSQVATARLKGIFGAPSFVAGDGELFWGNDRLEDALQWQSKL